MSRKRGRVLTAVAVGSVATCYVAYMARRCQRRWQRVKDATPTRPVHEASDIVLDAEVADFLISYEISPERGFIPLEDPLTSLPQHEFEAQEAIIKRLAQLLQNGQARAAIRNLPLVDVATLLTTDREQRRALLVYSAMAQAYIWGGASDSEPTDRLPPCVAIPLHRLSVELKTVPILTHMSICLDNWARRKGGDTEAVLRASGLRTSVSFTGQADEFSFNLITLEIEALGGPAVASLEKARRACARVLRGEVPPALHAHAHHLAATSLRHACTCIKAMTETMTSMPKAVDPQFFYTRVRPYLSGWKDNPNLPHGVLFEGVGWWGKRYHLSGGSAAQSSLVVCLDLYLGIHHNEGAGRRSYPFLRHMRRYMPFPHHTFLNLLEDLGFHSQPHLSIRAMAASLPRGHELARAYDDCVSALVEFRTRHLGIVAHYILAQQRSETPREAIQEKREGEGGQPGMLDVGRDSAGRKVGGEGPLRPHEGEGGLLVRDRGLEAAAGGKGTGGSDLMTFLKPLRDHTQHCRLTGEQRSPKEGNE